MCNSMYTIVVDDHCLMSKCPNCDADLTGIFCSNCGQRKIVGITWTLVLSNILDALEMKRGLLYNIKELTIAPHQFLNDYLKGAPRKILNPISYSIIIVTSCSIINGIIENVKSGYSGFEIFAINEYWGLILRIILPLYVAMTAVIAILSTKKIDFKLLILESLICSIFFSTHLLLILFAGYLVYLPFEGTTSLETIQIAVWIFIIVISLLYYIHSFRPKPKIPGSGLAKFLRVVSVLFVLFIAGSFVLFPIIFTTEGGGVSQPLRNKEIKKKIYSYDRLQLQTQGLVSLIGSAQNESDSTFALLHIGTQRLINRIDYLQQRILSEEDISLENSGSENIWKLADTFKYSSRIDTTNNENLIALIQEIRTYNHLLNQIDSTNTVFEIAWTSFRSKKNIEILYTLEQHKQELLLNEMLVLLER